MSKKDRGLLQYQADLQAEAQLVHAHLGLDRVLGAVGRPVLVGSAALGLMAWRDIDVTVVTSSLDQAAVLAAATELAAHPDVKALHYRDDSGRWNQDPGRYPDGLYLGLRHDSADMPEWKLDIWVVDEPDRQPDLAHLRTLPGRLTEEARLAILRIKTAWWTRPEYGKSVTSWDIYTAVLDHAIRSESDFGSWLAQSANRR